MVQNPGDCKEGALEGGQSGWAQAWLDSEVPVLGNCLCVCLCSSLQHSLLLLLQTGFVRAAGHRPQASLDSQPSSR